MIKNPVLPGFNPDPSICRVGGDYYIATSTFEWYPGVQIHHSRNLMDWQLVTRPLNRPAQLDMRGNPDSCGVWAPSLSFANGLYWLIYTDVKRYDGNFKDAHNYLVTCETIDGDWSDPVYLNSSGFDPSLFHDDDGRQWLINMQWNHRALSLGSSPLHSPFGGILMQEYSHSEKKLIDGSQLIFNGTDRGLVEAPHIFKRNEYYYLITAEGGTGYEHAITHARSRSVDGPYELHPDRHLLVSTPGAPLQRTGHGQYVETGQGEFYHTYLCSRPLPGTQRSPLGRETGIEKCVWGEDGWLRTVTGTTQARECVEPPVDAEPAAPAKQSPIIRFEQPILPSEFQWLRTPYPERLFSLTARDGFLRLYGRESIGSWFEQSLVARRQQHFNFTAGTTVEFMPTTFQQSAGLIAYYNRHKFHYLQITHDESIGRVLSIMSCNGDYPESALSYPVSPQALATDSTVSLKLVTTGAELQFYYAKSDEWIPIGPSLDASLLSDEGGRGEHASFTGAFVGMAAFDTSGCALHADFSEFIYAPEVAV